MICILVFFYWKILLVMFEEKERQERKKECKTWRERKEEIKKENPSNE